MSKVAARSAVANALRGLNMTPVMIDPRGAEEMATNLRELQACDDDDYMEKAEVRMRDNLCQAYGLGPANADKPFAFAQGTAIIPIHGALINRYGGYYFGYVTGYNFISAQMALASLDPDVERIVLDVNSNGGQAAGCFECSQRIADMRGDKPLLAVVDANCYSAAYALASAADRIVVTPSGGAGSIGVIAMHMDLSKMLDEIGIKVTLITAGAHKADGHPFAALPEDVQKDMQADIEQTYGQFVSLVAGNRGLDEKAVRDTEARCYSAQDAMAIGLVDGVAPPSQAVAEFISGPSGSTEKEERIVDPENDKNGPDANAQANAQALSIATTAGATAERDRISGIVNCEAAKGKPKMANHLAFSTSMTVAEAEAMLAVAGIETSAAAPAAGASAFQKAMDADNHPNMDPGNSAAAERDENDESDLEANLTRMGFEY